MKLSIPFWVLGISLLLFQSVYAQEQKVKSLGLTLSAARIFAADRKYDEAFQILNVFLEYNREHDEAWEYREKTLKRKLKPERDEYVQNDKVANELAYIYLEKARIQRQGGWDADVSYQSARLNACPELDEHPYYTIMQEKAHYKTFRRSGIDPMRRPGLSEETEGSKTTDADVALSYVERGEALLRRSKTDLVRRKTNSDASTLLLHAREAFGKALNQHPKCDRAYVGLGKVELERRDWRRAQLNFAKANLIKETSAAHLALASLSIESAADAYSAKDLPRYLDKAEEHFKRALELDPNCEEAKARIADFPRQIKRVGILHSVNNPDKESWGDRENDYHREWRIRNGVKGGAQ